MSCEASVSDRRSRIDLWLHLVEPNLLPVIAASVGVVLTALAGSIFGFEVNLQIYSVPILILGPSMILLVILAACLVTLFRERPDRPTLFLWSKLAGDWRFVERMLRGAPVFIVFPLFFGAFSSYKNAISRIVPFYADPYAMQIDRWIHGTDPWRLVQIVAGYPLVTFLINFCYNLWFFALFIVVAAAMFLITNIQLRKQYLLAFVLHWTITGGFIATLLSSVGPCFYSTFFHGAPFADLLAYLDQASLQYSIPARDVQNLILSGVEANRAQIGAGISALPSMHVGIATLNAILLSKFGRLAGLAGWTYASIIMVGSVHLGWHYAIDGYLAILLTVVVWKLAGFLSSLRMVGGRFGV